MSSNAIDPRLRDTPIQQPLPTLSQRPVSNNFQTSIGANTAATSSLSLLAQQQPHHQYHPQHDATPHHNQTSFLVHTPQSAGNHTDRDGSQDGGPNDPKRPRACNSCRGLKVKCDPDPSSPDGPCKRCAKAGRPCIVAQSSRKRQKKTDSRIAELEKKINTLQATLQATASGSTTQENQTGSEQQNTPVRPNPYQQVTNGSYNSQMSPYTTQPPGNEWSPFAKIPEVNVKIEGAPMVLAGQKRKHSGNREPTAMFPEPSGILSRKADEGRALYDQVNGAFAQGAKAPQIHEYSDVIDRGLLTAEIASQIFDSFVEKMTPHFPAVIFPADTPASRVRKETPTLFLAILAAGSGSKFPNLQKPLTKEVMTMYADRIIIKGEKSLELVQALHVSTLWYWPPEHFEELKFYQLIHIAAVMALDIGMGKANKSSKYRNAGLFRDHPWRKQPYPDPESVEARRAWVTCYFLCCNTSMGLRRPNLIRWTSFMDNCVVFLETSPDAAPSDRTLTQWIRSQKIAEDVGHQFSMDDPAAKVTISDPKVQYALKGFEQDLEKWYNQVPVESRSRSLKMTEHVVNLYMHEIAMHVDHNVEEFKPPYSEETLRGLTDGSTEEALTPHHINALSTCLTSIDGTFETFLQFDVESVRCLPVANFVRVAYAVVVLIKMYFAASSPNSGIGKVFDKDNMKVEEHLDGLVNLFNAASAENRSRPSAKFLMVLIMLKTWFHRQKNGKTAQETPPGDAGPLLTSASDGDGKQRPSSHQQDKQGYSTTNTPLQLLSEVATGNSRGQPRNDNPYLATSDDWQPLQQYPNYGPGGPMSQANYLGDNVDPGLGSVEPNYTNDGFEQAMGFTLAGLGLDSNLGDNVFFTGMMNGGTSFEGF